jgi:hypothetical protein
MLLFSEIKSSNTAAFYMPQKIMINDTELWIANGLLSYIMPQISGPYEDKWNLSLVIDNNMAVIEGKMINYIWLLLNGQFPNQIGDNELYMNELVTLYKFIDMYALPEDPYFIKYVTDVKNALKKACKVYYNDFWMLCIHIDPYIMNTIMCNNNIDDYLEYDFRHDLTRVGLNESLNRIYKLLNIDHMISTDGSFDIIEFDPHESGNKSMSCIIMKLILSEDLPEKYFGEFEYNEYLSIMMENEVFTSLFIDRKLPRIYHEMRDEYIAKYDRRNNIKAPNTKRVIDSDDEDKSPVLKKRIIKTRVSIRKNDVSDEEDEEEIDVPRKACYSGPHKVPSRR